MIILKYDDFISFLENPRTDFPVSSFMTQFTRLPNQNDLAEPPLENSAPLSVLELGFHLYSFDSIPNDNVDEVSFEAPEFVPTSNLYRFGFCLCDHSLVLFPSAGVFLLQTLVVLLKDINSQEDECKLIIRVYRNFSFDLLWSFTLFYADERVNHAATLHEKKCKRRKFREIQKRKIQIVVL